MRHASAPTAALALLAALGGCMPSSDQLLAQLPGGVEATGPAAAPTGPTVPGARPVGAPMIGAPVGATGAGPVSGAGPTPAASPAPGAPAGPGASAAPSPLNAYNPLFVEGRTWVYRLTEQRGGGMAATSDFTVRVKTVSGATVTVAATQVYTSSAGGGPLPPSGPDQPSTFPLDARNPFIKWGGGTATPPISTAQEGVSVPAGDFQAVKETYQSSDAVAPQVDELWMVPGVGMVKRRISTKGSTTAPVNVFELKTKPS